MQAKVDIAAIQARDAILEIKRTKTGLNPAQILLWFQKHQDLDKEITLFAFSAQSVKQRFPDIYTFQKVRYMFKIYFLLYRNLKSCKIALHDFQRMSQYSWLNKYQYLFNDELELYCGDLLDQKIFMDNKYHINIDCTFFAPVVNFLELYEAAYIKVKRGF